MISFESNSNNDISNNVSYCLLNVYFLLDIALIFLYIIFGILYSSRMRVILLTYILNIYLVSYRN